MDDQVSGKLAVTASPDGIRIEASDGVPTSLIVQVVDSYSMTRRRNADCWKEERAKRKKRDFIQSGLMLAALIFSFGFVLNVAGCGGQSSPYKQYESQWGAAK